MHNTADRPSLDPDLTPVAGISPSGNPYVGATMQVNGKPYFTAFDIPEHLIVCMNAAADKLRKQVAPCG
ncbi:MAG TPA: hypothetical protein VHQ21_18055 [Rhodanobacteraceae bacterium]|nr:hypothetical protein [Rhodanobacteraceae bacterium]